ncbi:hemin uptake protein HemP [Thioalkalivibrio sp. XN8]|uniref:hemin uptake protein HemP n=1 Tax=Thioalkalivibrio sp. XN8 TaxID=2712863 RepID=UPI0013ED3382|nr:hemin uptake protein HemP [Thioalkalivibrio sp. XN8]NGP53996.1 hemin uptake protein HemP [Thioalkalivibrio sp. XN8]
MNKQSPEPRAAAAQGVVNRLSARPARIPSRVVLGGDHQVVIVHGADEYLLKLTSDGKLVLTR